MAAKTAIRDTARVLDLPLQEADRVAKLVPDFIKLRTLFEKPTDELKKQLQGDDFIKYKRLKKLSKGNDLIS